MHRVHREAHVRLSGSRDDALVRTDGRCVVEGLEPEDTARIDEELKLVSMKNWMRIDQVG
jgi:hypothetical protein